MGGKIKMDSKLLKSSDSMQHVVDGAVSAWNMQ